jgi:hypothetical protein
MTVVKDVSDHSRENVLLRATDLSPQDIPILSATLCGNSGHFKAQMRPP